MFKELSVRADSWFRLLVFVSACLAGVTFLSYALQGSASPRLSQLLFLIGLGGENNVGAWWSGTLLLLASVFAFDGYASHRNSDAERRGWLTLALVLIMLSFDEIASLHEYIISTARPLIVVPGLIGAGMTLYAFHQLISAKVDRRMIVRLGVAFALLATIPMQEVLQHAREWNDPVLYGVRALIEEGAEIAAMLIFVDVTRKNTERLARRGDALRLTALYRRPLLAGAAVSLPFLTWASFVLPYPGGPADWLTVSLYVLCALHVVRAMLSSESPNAVDAIPLLALYAAASLSANALKLAWDPQILGTPVSVRGLGMCVLLIAAALVLRRFDRPAKVRWLLPAAAVALAAAVATPSSQTFWCAFPAVLALYLYAIESRFAEGHAGRAANADAFGHRARAG